MAKQTKQELSEIDVPEFLNKPKKAQSNKRPHCITVRHKYVMPSKLSLLTGGSLLGLSMGVCFILAVWAMCRIF